MAAFFAGGTAVDIVLAMLAVEAVLLMLAGRLGGPFLALRGLGWSIASGGCLVLGLRAVIAGAPWPWLALALSASFAAHLMDLRQRLRAAQP